MRSRDLGCSLYLLRIFVPGEYSRCRELIIGLFHVIFRQRGRRARPEQVQSRFTDRPNPIQPNAGQGQDPEEQDAVVVALLSQTWNRSQISGSPHLSKEVKLLSGDCARGALDERPGGCGWTIDPRRTRCEIHTLLSTVSGSDSLLPGQSPELGAGGARVQVQVTLGQAGRGTHTQDSNSTVKT